MNPRPLYLHMGLPKTASTWLQDRVFPALDGVTTRSVPRTDMFVTAEDRAVEFRIFACVLRRSASVWPEMGDAVLRDILGDAARSDLPLLISDEAIGRAASRPESLVAHLRGFAETAARAGFAPPRLLVLVRRQDYWLASHYAQISDRRRWAGQRDFEAMVTATLDPARNRLGFGMLLDYGRLHAALVEIVGADGVLVLPYEALAAEPEVTLGLVLSWLGLPAAQAARLVSTSGRANVRTEREGALPVWRLRPPSLPLGRGRRVAAPAALWPPQRIAVSKELSDAVLTAYGPSSRQLARATGLDLARWGYFASPSRACPET